MACAHERQTKQADRSFKDFTATLCWIVLCYRVRARGSQPHSLFVVNCCHHSCKQDFPALLHLISLPVRLCSSFPVPRASLPDLLALSLFISAPVSPAQSALSSEHRQSQIQTIPPVTNRANL